MSPRIMGRQALHMGQERETSYSLIRKQFLQEESHYKDHVEFSNHSVKKRLERMAAVAHVLYDNVPKNGQIQKGVISFPLSIEGVIQKVKSAYNGFSHYKDNGLSREVVTGDIRNLSNKVGYDFIFKE